MCFHCSATNNLIRMKVEKHLCFFILFVHKILRVVFGRSMANFTLLLIIVATQATSFDSRFIKVDLGDGITGRVETNFSFITLDDCIIRCVEKNISTYLDKNSNYLGFCYFNQLKDDFSSIPFRCSRSSDCKALQYNGTRPGNCILISDNSTSGDGTMFLSDLNYIIFLKGKDRWIVLCLVSVRFGNWMHVV